MPPLPSKEFAVAASRCPSPFRSPRTTTQGEPPESCGVDAVNVPSPFPRSVHTSCPSLPAATRSMMPSLFMSPAARPHSPFTPPSKKVGAPNTPMPLLSRSERLLSPWFAFTDVGVAVAVHVEHDDAVRLVADGDLRDREHAVAGRRARSRRCR
jgi:hypothetical protein